jgi:hypothetical protein
MPQEVYPMDFYARGSGGWTNMHTDNAKRQFNVSAEPSVIPPKPPVKA